MSWFKKKEEKKVPSLSELPRLPKLPELPNIRGGELDDSKIHQLPSFPTNALGEKFSQDTIKEAIAGEKEGGEVFGADDFATNNTQMMQKPLKKPPIKRFPNLEKRKGVPLRRVTEEISEDVDEGIPEAVNEEIPEDSTETPRRTEPLFIRIDKFEESLKIFENTKNKISEMEKMLKSINEIKENEERELKFWEEEIKMIKKQIEKVDENLFSKI